MWVPPSGALLNNGDRVTSPDNHTFQSELLPLCVTTDETLNPSCVPLHSQYYLIAGTAGQQLNLPAITIPGVTREVSGERATNVSMAASVTTYPLCQMKRRDLVDILNRQFCRLGQPFRCRKMIRLGPFWYVTSGPSFSGL